MIDGGKLIGGGRLVDDGKLVGGGRSVDDGKSVSEEWLIGGEFLSDSGFASGFGEAFW